MKKEDLDAFASIVASKIKMDQDEHKGHHIFIDAMMTREAAKQARWDKVQNSVIGAIVLAVLGGIGKLVLMGVDAYVSSK